MVLLYPIRIPFKNGWVAEFFFHSHSKKIIWNLLMFTFGIIQGSEASFFSDDVYHLWVFDIVVPFGFPVHIIVYSCQFPQTRQYNIIICRQQRLLDDITPPKTLGPWVRRSFQFIWEYILEERDGRISQNRQDISNIFDQQKYFDHMVWAFDVSKPWLFRPNKCILNCKKGDPARGKIIYHNILSAVVVWPGNPSLKLYAPG